MIASRVTHSDGKERSSVCRECNAAARHSSNADGRRPIVRLTPFRRKIIRAQKIGYRLETDPRMLDRLGDAGALSFNDLYVRL
jgi:hypothetical protein